MLTNDSSKTLAEVVFTEKSPLLVFPLVRGATARFFLLNRHVIHILLSANAYDLNHQRLVSEKNMPNRCSGRKMKTKKAIETILGSRVYCHPFLISISSQRSSTTQFI